MSRNSLLHNPSNKLLYSVMQRDRKEAAWRLYEIAEGQQGFFRTRQAKAAGFAENTHTYHVRVGNWIREHRGIYRLAIFYQVRVPT